METAVKNATAPKNAGIRENRICFPIANNSKVEIANDLNGAALYCLVDLDENTKTYLDLNEIHKAFQSGEKGFKALNFATMVCKQISQMQFRILKNSDINVLIPKGKDLETNIELIKNNDLVSFNALTDVKGSCSGSCSSCSSSSCSS